MAIAALIFAYYTTTIDGRGRLTNNEKAPLSSWPNVIRFPLGLHRSREEHLWLP